METRKKIEKQEKNAERNVDLAHQRKMPWKGEKWSSINPDNVEALDSTK